MDCHEHLSSISEIILGETKAYVIFEKHYGDLHSYVRQRKRLKEDEACRLFQQIVSAVEHCHTNGIVLRDLKLRKFVFKNPERWATYFVVPYAYVWESYINMLWYYFGGFVAKYNQE